MPLNVADTFKVPTMAPTAASPLSIPDDPRTANLELLSPRIEAPDTSIRTTFDTNTSPLTEDLSNTDPSDISASNGQVIPASLETSFRTAHPSLEVDPEVDIPSPETGEMYSSQTSDPTVPIEDVSTFTSGLPITNLLEKQEPLNSAELSPHIDSFHTATDISITLPTETTSTELPKLHFGPFPDKDAREAASPSDIFDASEALSEAMDSCSPKDEVLSNSSKEQPSLKSPSSQAGPVDMTPELEETSSAESTEGIPSNSSPSTETASDILPGAMELSTAEDGVLSACKEDQPGIQSLPTNFVLPNMPSEVAYSNSDESQEVTTSGPSSPIEDPSEMLPSVSIFRPLDGGSHSDFTEDQPGLNSTCSEAGDADMTSIAIEVKPTESAGTIKQTNSESSIVPSNMVLSYPVAETTTDGDETLEYLPTEVIEPRALSNVATELVPANIEVLDAKVEVENAEASSAEISKFGLAATASRDEKSSSSTPEDSTIVSGASEEQAEIQEHREAAEVTSDARITRVPPTYSDEGLEQVDENMMDSSDSSPETEETTSKETILLHLDSSVVFNSNFKPGPTECGDMQEISASEKETTAAVDPMASAVDALNNASDFLYTIANEISNSVFPPQPLNASFPSVATDINSIVAEISETVQPEMEDQTRSASSTPLGSPRYSFGGMDFEYTSVEADITDTNAVAVERSETVQLEAEDQIRSASTSSLSSPRYSITDMDDDFVFGKQPNTNLQDLDLPDTPMSDLAPHSVVSTTMPDKFNLNGQEATEQFAFETSLLNSPFSAEERNISCEVDEDKYTESSTMAFEHAGRRSPEIKLEPMAVEPISYLDIFPSPIDSSSFSWEVFEPPSPIVKGEKSFSDVPLDTVPLADTNALTTAGENLHALSSDTKVEPDTVDVVQDVQSPDTRRIVNSKSPRKRTPSPEGDETGFQQPPAKKLRQEVVSACDAPQIKTEDNVSCFPEGNEGAHLVAQHPLNGTDDMRTIMSPPSTPPYTNLNQVKTEIIDFKTGDISCLITQKPQSSANRTIEKQKMVSITTSTSTNGLRPTVKKNSVKDTVELRVGSNRKCVLVHKHILAKSPFFASLMSKHPDPKESPRAYSFKNFDTYAFSTVIYWLYQGNIRSIAEDYKADEIFNTTHMVKVYCLCVKLQLRSLRNLAIELLGHGYLKNDSAPSIEEIDIAYNETEHESSLRIYLATWAQCRQHAPLQKYMMAGPWNRDQFKALCKKHLDLARSVAKLDHSTGSMPLTSINPRFHHICWYHEHTEGERCGVADQTFETACNGVKSRISEVI